MHTSQFTAGLSPYFAMVPFYPCFPHSLHYPDRDLLKYAGTKMGMFPYKRFLLLYVYIIIYIKDKSIIKSLLKSKNLFIFSLDVIFSGIFLRIPV